MDNQNLLTREGLSELKDELKMLINIERPKVIEDIKEARNQGDLSENAEFDAARERQGQIEDRISEIEVILDSAKIVNKTTSAKIKIGSQVEIQNLKTLENATYTIVGPLEADPFQSKISNISPVAMALLGSEKNDIVTVHAIKKYDIKIISIK